MESTRYERNGYVEWLNEQGQRHRTDGPAVESANGYREWYVNGKPHRTDGPAVESANGYRAWYVNGKRHRTDGPAVEYSGGTQEWWENGKCVYIYDPNKKEGVLNAEI